ncbi:SRPBCC family protein [Streptomyces sp. NPDC054756]
MDAPVKTVWQAWTIAGRYGRWAGAEPGSVEMDVRPGGAWKATMVTPDGSRFPLTGSYLDVVTDRRLVVGMDVPGRPGPAVMTVELDARDGDRTEIVACRAPRRWGWSAGQRGEELNGPRVRV